MNISICTYFTFLLTALYLCLLHNFCNLNAISKHVHKNFVLLCLKYLYFIGKRPTLSGLQPIIMMYSDKYLTISNHYLYLLKKIKYLVITDVKSGWFLKYLKCSHYHELLPFPLTVCIKSVFIAFNKFISPFVEIWWQSFA